MSGVLHRYRATCQWEGSTLAGYDQYPRAHSLRLIGPELDLQLSSDAAFHGDSRRANPEQLLLAAAVSCQLLSFLAVAARARLDVLRYSDDAEAEMSEADKPVRITRIRLRPEILMAVGPAVGTSEERVRRLVEQAHRECFIANSLKSEMLIEPSLAFLGGGG
jgi:organic hydroperoxide reductase OsmC/OhrA